MKSTFNECLTTDLETIPIWVTYQLSYYGGYKILLVDVFSILYF